ncbi:hypothetical protein MIND_01347700 [Mycena indigotica]|uniref:DUF6589 domain-containing protein n=1 Tax=Mycena indigotica TaxID=2126181 RepID=A0A8H6VRW3_9AGAR|nr:uncharacterized protein MIND_01347700 [Mycena indigotica]KAF7289741.1 hypothetical protein MIND_01347700 [Mycena indigotica]
MPSSKATLVEVVNILRIWTLMMRSPKTMPRYADAMFETLVRIKHFPDKQRELYLANWLVNLSGRPFGFKPVDLLQEHQNMWAKTVYNAKGANKNWNWLAMITVCIYSLREAMRTVQTSFRIPAYGEKHKSPEIKAEVAIIAAALKPEDNNIQAYTANRPANDHIKPVRDLLREGASQASTRKAFARFTRDIRRAKRHGFEVNTMEQEAGEEDEGDEAEQHEYDARQEDLEIDDDELAMNPELLLEAAREMADAAFAEMDIGD